MPRQFFRNWWLPPLSRDRTLYIYNLALVSLVHYQYRHYTSQSKKEDMPNGRRKLYFVAFESAFHYSGSATGLAAKYLRCYNGSRGRRGTVRSFLSTRKYGTKTSLRRKSLWIRGKREGNITKSLNIKNMVDISHHLTIPVAPQWLLQNVLRTKHSYWWKTKKKTVQISIYLVVWRQTIILKLVIRKLLDGLKTSSQTLRDSSTEKTLREDYLAHSLLPLRLFDGSVDVNGLYWTTTFPTKNERMMVDSGSLSNITDGTNAIQNISKNGLLIVLGMQPRNNKKSLSGVHACHYTLELARSYPKTMYDGTQSIIVSQMNRFVSDLLSYNMTTWIACPVL